VDLAGTKSCVEGFGFDMLDRSELLLDDDRSMKCVEKRSGEILGEVCEKWEQQERIRWRTVNITFGCLVQWVSTPNLGRPGPIPPDIRSSVQQMLWVKSLSPARRRHRTMIEFHASIDENSDD